MSEVIFKGKPLYISDHALQRFQDRWLSSPKPANPLKTMANMLNRSKPEIISKHYHTLRIINNGFKEAEYFECEKWRFVVVVEDGKKTLVTAEIKR